MLENLKRIREPLAWVVLVVLAVELLVLVAQVLSYLNGGIGAEVALWAGLGMVAAWVPFLLAAVAAVVACHLAPALPRAGLLARVAAVVTTIGLVLGVGAGGYAMSTVPRMVDYLPALVSELPAVLLAALACVVFWALARPAPREADDLTEEEVAALEPPVDDDRPAPVWSREEAAGTAWRTADEAAAGRPGDWSIATPDEPEEPPTSRG